MLVTLHNVHKSFGSKLLFDGLNFSVNDRDKIGLIGPNGSGKSTLMKIMARTEEVDSGDVSSQKGALVTYIGQSSEFSPDQSVSEVIASVIPEGQRGGAEALTQIATVLSILGFENPDRSVGELSGGWKKRLSIGQALVLEPDLILLDEPTNHMDWEGIYWLEGLLKNSVATFVIISHDRTFLENVTNRVVEINAVYKGGYLSWNGNYSKFLEKKAEYIEAQKNLQASMSNKLRREVEWLRRSPQARTTKSRSRIKAAYDLSDNLGEVKDRNLTVSRSSQIEFAAGESTSKKLIEIKAGTISLGGKKLFSDLDMKIGPGQCVGILGLNGTGKSTLLKVISKDLELDSGTIYFADGLKVIYFDQSRDQLNPEDTLMEALTGGDSEFVLFNGQSLHGAAYARKFLFSVEQFNMKIKYLSGGEQARVLLARLMLNDADILLLDEPTNDLDIETLDVLESSLAEFPGAIFLVSHDRCFLEKVHTDLLALEGDGVWNNYPDFYQWESVAFKKPAPESLVTVKERPEKKQNKKKLSYMEQKEWESIEADIELAEASLEKSQNRLQEPTVMSDEGKLAEVIDEVANRQQAVEKFYERWEYLEDKLK